MAVLGISSRLSAGAPNMAPDTTPLALPAVPAPAATSPACARLVAALPQQLPGPAGPLPRRPLAEPAPPGTAAWAAAPQPVVLRCGLDRPAELTASSALLQINGVRWLTLAGGEIAADTFVAVDRPAYAALTVPRGLGSGPVQAISDTVLAGLPTCEPMQPRQACGG